MKKQFVLSFAASCLFLSCSLEDVIERGEICPPFENAVKGATLARIGDVDCNENECSVEGKDYLSYIQIQACPPEYSKCEFDSSNHYYYCQKNPCEKNQHLYKTECQNDSTEHCGSHENNCTEIPGWAEGSCISRTCQASQCQPGYELKSGKCEAEIHECKKGTYFDSVSDSCLEYSVEHCGNYNNNCKETLGWLDGSCSEDGQCQASACDINAGTILDLNTKTCIQLGCPADSHTYLSECEKNTLENCGKHESACQNWPGWINGSCSESGSCIASECEDGFELSDSRCYIADNHCNENQHPVNKLDCEDNTVEHCMSARDDCTLRTGWQSGVCIQGMCVVELCQEGYCVAPDGSCYDGSNSKEKGSLCGSDGKKCAVCTVNQECLNGECVSSQCAVDEHFFENACEKDSLEHCGNHETQCINPDHGTIECISGHCVVTSCDSGYKNQGLQCIENKCDSGYHLYNSQCEKDSIDNCAEHGNVCPSVTNGEPVCNLGKCDFTCVSGYDKTQTGCSKSPDNPSECPDGYHIHNNGCEANSDFNCGGHGLKCLKADFLNAVSVECTENGDCVVNECESNYHHDGKYKCEINDIDHCASPTNKCSIPTNGNTACINGQCVVTCYDNYHLEGDSCVATRCESIQHPHQNGCEDNTDLNCGAHGAKCLKSDFLNASAVSCTTTGDCRVDRCNSGYHKYGNYQCEIDSNINCASHGNKCTSPVNGKSECTNGQCVITCYDNYHLEGSSCVATACSSSQHPYQNGCEDNTDLNCGAHGAKCLKSDFLNASAVSCTTTGDCRVDRCNSGYHKYGNYQCEKDDATHCGSHTNTCSKTGATATCVGGACSYQCNAGYHDYGSICEKSTAEHCKSHEHKCTGYNICCWKTSSTGTITTACVQEKMSNNYDGCN